MEPTGAQLIEAVERLAALTMFPAGKAARKEIMYALSRMVNDKPVIDWLVLAMVDIVGIWRGTAFLRAVLCSCYDPADGVRAEFTREDYRDGFEDCRFHRPGALLVESGQVKRLSAPAEPPPTPQEAAAEGAFKMEFSEKAKKLMRMPTPTKADREYSDKLLRGVGA